jgi:antitoxin (DNA-binding transcriptional repressor) of toxin-antitoxin stability system
MRTVNIAELKDRLSMYVNFARCGEEIIVRDRNLPVAKLIPFNGDANDEERRMVAEGKLKLSEEPFDSEKFWKIKTAKVAGNQAVEALLQDREEGW